MKHPAEPSLQRGHKWTWLLSEDPSTQQRMLGCLMATALLAAYGCILVWMGRIGLAAWPAVGIWTAVALGVQLLISAWVRSRRSKPLEESVCTMVQMGWGVICVAASYPLAPMANDVLPCLVAIMLIFGATSLRLRHAVAMTMYAMVVTSTTIVLTTHFQGRIAGTPELMQLTILAGLLLACVGVCAKLHRQRQLMAQELEAHRSLASRDALTGLLNRRSMLELLHLEQRRCLRGTSGMLLVVMDLDHFKLINDRYGHAAGDRALQCFADTVRHAIRSSDVLARWGGEEFVLLLTNMELSVAQTMLERVSRTLQNTAVPDAPHQLRITVSCGLAQHVASESVEATLERADRALYEAKHLGRNRVVVAPTPDLQEVTPPSLAPAKMPTANDAPTPTTSAAHGSDASAQVAHAE